jgi:hypothetical protein
VVSHSPPQHRASCSGKAPWSSQYFRL